MQFNRDEYVFLSRRGSVPRASRAGPCSRSGGGVPGRPGRARYAPLLRRVPPAVAVAVREFRIALHEAGEHALEDRGEHYGAR